MNEHERRYRRSVGRTDSAEMRERYRRLSEKQAAQSKNSQMTYDDYLAQAKDIEKIIEVDDDSRWIKFKEAAADYFSWVSDKKEKYAPIAKERAKTLAKEGFQKQPIHRQSVKRWIATASTKLDPLREKYGQKNVQYGLFTGTAVLVLLGGFVLFRGDGGSASDSVAVTGLENGAVQGAEAPAQPTFDVITPDDNTLTSAIKFDPSQGVASYQDKVKEHTLTISQQPLTDEQKQNKEAEIEKIAINLLAEISFETQFGTTYLTNTAPDGTNSQVAFFMTQDLLVFIRTGGTAINPDAWVEYINSIN